MSRKKNNVPREEDNIITNMYITQAISQPDSRQKKTGVAMPDDKNVEIAHEWVNFNEK